MKSFREWMNERELDEAKGKNQVYTYFPKSNSELKELVTQLIKERGDKANLNDIDVSNITDMENMFYNSPFNGDISKWNVGNVTSMDRMFYDSPFDGDISKWNVSKVESMKEMFRNSSFNGDISKWNVSRVEDNYGMLKGSPLEKNPPAWYKG